ncbi:hypothetical protein [uncultured Desulfobacter sp.]|uniref:hypothetical protein n=1 Tax=uncultured Desulfobacter sp. TaxID=240139 RepID=UPI002AAB315E|nr:hypothetical protein [uncultured Desulfobacter sp.]
MCNCNCKCMEPQKLKDKPENCTSEQIEQCHGKDGGHPCACNTDETKQNKGKNE